MKITEIKERKTKGGTSYEVTLENGKKGFSKTVYFQKGDDIDYQIIDSGETKGVPWELWKIMVLVPVQQTPHATPVIKSSLVVKISPEAIFNAKVKAIVAVMDRVMDAVLQDKIALGQVNETYHSIASCLCDEIDAAGKA
jgi:hypothetical protein